MLLVLVGWSFVDPHLRRLSVCSPRRRASTVATLATTVAARPADRRDHRRGNRDLRRRRPGDGADQRNLPRSPRHRAADRLDRLHGSARPRPGGERARRPRLRRARRAGSVARRLGGARLSQWPMSRLSATMMFVFPRLLIAPFLDPRRRRRAGGRGARRCRSCGSPRSSRSSTARRRRSPTCCAASTIRAGRWSWRSPAIGRSARRSASRWLSSRRCAAVGLWIGLACGLGAVALQLLWRWRSRESAASSSAQEARGLPQSSG